MFLVCPIGFIVITDVFSSVSAFQWCCLASEESPVAMQSQCGLGPCLQDSDFLNFVSEMI